MDVNLGKSCRTKNKVPMGITSLKGKIGNPIASYVKPTLRASRAYSVVCHIMIVKNAIMTRVMIASITNCVL